MLEFTTSKIPNKNAAVPFVTPIKPSLHPTAADSKHHGSTILHAARRLMAQRRALRPPDPTSSTRSFGRTRRISRPQKRRNSYQTGTCPRAKVVTRVHHLFLARRCRVSRHSSFICTRVLDGFLLKCARVTLQNKWFPF